MSKLYIYMYYMFAQVVHFHFAESMQFNLKINDANPINNPLLTNICQCIVFSHTTNVENYVSNLYPPLGVTGIDFPKIFDVSDSMPSLWSPPVEFEYCVTYALSLKRDP